MSGPARPRSRGRAPGLRPQSPEGRSPSRSRTWLTPRIRTACSRGLGTSGRRHRCGGRLLGPARSAYRSGRAPDRRGSRTMGERPVGRGSRPPQSPRRGSRMTQDPPHQTRLQRPGRDRRGIAAPKSPQARRKQVPGPSRQVRSSGRPTGAPTAAASPARLRPRPAQTPPRPPHRAPGARLSARSPPRCTRPGG